ncbi:MAG TPA: threonine/serine dehydratase [Gemmatimonadaceae bacterium]|nr:threonine/serine dehydratase [Gemmatimonadaceae bacterium]
MFSDLRPVDVLAAGARLRGIARRTPLRRSPTLSRRVGADVMLKLECEQLTGSFKLRGAFNAIATLPTAVRERGVVASSAGNHGLGVAWAAHHFGIPATIFVPATAPRVKREGIEQLGAMVNAEAPHYDAAMALARDFAKERGATFVHPCMGSALLAGQGTVALEILEELPSLRTIVVPVGGGGLVGGCGILLRAVAPYARIIGVQSVNTNAMALSLTAGRVVSPPVLPTLADGLAGDIDDYALDIGRHVIDELYTVEEEDIADAIRHLAREESATVEGSGAVGAAAILTGAVKEVEGEVAVVVSGGNIDRDRLDGIVGA